MSESAVYEELANVVRNYPVFAGDTLSHETANECGRRGWAKRNHNGDWIPTPEGRLAYWHSLDACVNRKAIQ